MSITLRTRLHGVSLAVLLAGLGACRVDPPTSPVAGGPALTRAGAPTVTLTDLGALSGGGWTIAAYGINERGDIVGGGFTGGTAGRFVAFLWTADGGARPIDGWDRLAYSRADAINARGDIVGAGCPIGGGQCTAVTWTGGGTIDVLTSPVVYSLNAINARGQAVGTVSGGVAVRSPDGRLERLDRAAEALDINDGGDVVGSALGGFAALWRKGGAPYVIPTPGTKVAAASGINNRGEVVGFIGPHFYSMGFLWSPQSGLTMLETPAGWYSHPEAINERGETAGWINQGGPDSWTRAAMWTMAGDLVILGPSEFGRRSAAYDISERGEVVGAYEVAGANSGAHAALWTVRGGTGQGTP
jgi:uncharacterized membrane protein